VQRLLKSVASTKHRATQSHKWRRIFAKLRPNSHTLPSQTFNQVLRPNFGVCRTSAHL